METTLNMDDILSRVRQLSVQEQQILLNRLLTLLRRENEQSVNHILLSSISGVGAAIWTGTDIEEYVEKERQW